MISINDTSILINNETVDNNDVLRHVVERYGKDSAATKAAILRAMLEEINLPTPGEIIKTSGEWMVDWALTERLGITVVDGRKITAQDNAEDRADFFEIVDAIYGSREEFEWLNGKGSCYVDRVIFVGADVPEECRIFAAYHEYGHYLDYIRRNIVRPRLAHASIRSSRVEKECDLYALLRVISVWIEDEKGDFPVESVIEWMVHSHYQWEVEHPQQVSDLLYRAVLLYRFARQHGIKVDPVFDMKKLQKSKRWWE